MELENLILPIENQIRRGEFEAAQLTLNTNLAPSKVPRKYVAIFANLTRRAGLLELSLKILKPALRPDGGDLARDITSEELAEYAASLNQIGALEEATELFKRIDETSCPRSLLYQSFSLFRFWKYAEAIPLLEKYCHLVINEPYQFCVGQVNLASALVVQEKFTLAEDILNSVEPKLISEKAETLLLNVKDLRLQIAAARSEDLNPTESVASNPTTRHDFRFFKRLFFYRCVKHPTTVKEGDFETFKRKAWEFKDWDAIRDCDFYRGLILKENLLLKKVFFGSPFDRYREMISKVSGIENALEGSFIWSHPFPDQHARISMDLASGKTLDGKVVVTPGSISHRILSSLCTDFYRPILLGELYRKVYPDEFFDPISSPNKLHNALFHLRKVSEKLNLGFSIEERNNSFKLHLGENFSITVSRRVQDRFVENRKQGAIQKLKKAFQEHPFSAKQAEDVLGISRTHAVAILNDGIETAQLQKSRKGRVFQYQFKS